MFDLVLKMKILVAFVCLNAHICILGCNVGWVQLNNTCYMFSHQTATWGEAASMCRGFKSKLAEPMTQDEVDFLISHSQNEAGNFWLGISDIIEENRWVYSSNQHKIIHSGFNVNQPDQHTLSNCVVQVHAYHGKWADEPCRTAYNFICEQVHTGGGQEILG